MRTGGIIVVRCRITLPSIGSFFEIVVNLILLVVIIVRLILIVVVLVCF